MAKTLGDTTTLYYDQGSAQSGTPDANWVTAGCLFDLVPPGYTFDVIDDELCLTDPANTSPEPRIGDEQTDEITATLAYDPESEVDSDLRTAATNKYVVSWRIDYPDTGTANPPDGGWRDAFDGQIQIFKPESIVRREFMRASLSIIRSGSFTRAVQV